MSGRTHDRACPERTCVGCRERAAKNDLLRIVRIEDACVPDPRGTLPGRGAYVHPALVCLDLAVRRRAFPRALRVPGALDTKALRRYVEQTRVAEQATP
ncbi:YlxR family protein [Streptomyces sp. NPDC051452]|uniref:YlxR family protein n=1 Tax=Streptomyces sp. NPDC051452 TaxID=3365654 RepID=UPI00379BC62D